MVGKGPWGRRWEVEVRGKKEGGRKELYVDSIFVFMGKGILYAGLRKATSLAVGTCSRERCGHCYCKSIDPIPGRTAVAMNRQELVWRNGECK